MQDSKNVKRNGMEKLPIGLYIVATPIGNLDDISLRAQKILNSVDFIICENPIHSLKLLNKFGIKKKLFSLHDYNEELLIKQIKKYQFNHSFALISDAGSPLVSDPGYKLVQDYINEDLFITSIPGPSSIISSLQLSGLPINQFKFCGFVPKNKKNLDIIINSIKYSQITLIFFISGLRLIDFLQEIIGNKIDRHIAICKEISKKNERVFRGNISKVINDISFDKKYIKGEFVVIIGGKEREDNKTLSSVIELQIINLLQKYTLTEVVEIVHKLTNISKKIVYKKALQLKND